MKVILTLNLFYPGRNMHMKKKIIGLFVCMLLLTTLVPAAGSQTDCVTTPMIPSKSLEPTPLGGWTEIQKILASDGAIEDCFGSTVSVDGTTALIGAPDDDDNGISSGSVYVFTFSGSSWTKQAKLLALDGAEWDLFGFCVSLDGDTALIGSYNDNDSGNYSGSAYVFTRNGTTWTQQAKILASDGAEEDNFGFYVSLSGDTALIGAPYDDDNEADSGSAYVFTRSSGSIWTEQQKLLASDGAAQDFFAGCLSLDGDTALIAAHSDDDLGGFSGSAYVFIRNGTTWTQQQKLLASDGEEQDVFGTSVYLDSDTALIGAIGDDDNNDWSGAAYVFTRTNTTWTQEAKLKPSNGVIDQFFGVSVSLDGNTALIGASHDDDHGYHSGSAYVFIRSGTNWIEQQKLLASDGAVDDFFGDSVDLDGDTAFIGAKYDDDSGVDSGSVYVFGNNQPPTPPTISGPHCGKINTDYTFTIGPITEPDGDQLYCLFDWGDGNISGWLGPIDSGQTFTATHQWSEPGIYKIRVKAKDAYGTETDWSEPFTIYITSKVLLVGLAKSVVNQSEECIILNMSIALIIKFRPMNPKIYSSVQVLILNDEVHGIIGQRFLAGLVYALVLTEAPSTIIPPMIYSPKN
jgi:hypothetical protein